MSEIEGPHEIQVTQVESEEHGVCAQVMGKNVDGYMGYVVLDVGEVDALIMELGWWLTEVLQEDMLKVYGLTGYRQGLGRGRKKKGGEDCLL